jgi:hypothetical protein
MGGAGRPLPGAPAGRQATALYDFKPEADNELGFAEGDVINIIKQEGDWWTGELRGKRGLLPATYVQLI